MNWIELSIETPEEFVEPISSIFYRYGHGGVAVETKGGYNPDEGESLIPDARVTVKTYLPVNDSTKDRLLRIELAVRLIAHVAPISDLTERAICEQDWLETWKEHFHTLHIGKRLVIIPSWEKYSPKKKDIVITLDPEMAFGTGHHPTTRMCLEQLESLHKPHGDVLDLGCGSGILSIAAAKLGAQSVLGLDVDPTAIKTATNNVLKNNVSDRVRIYQGSLPHSSIRPNTYDLAVANISSKVISELADDLILATKDDGTIIVSGILVDNSQDVKNSLISAGAQIQDSTISGDWVTFIASVP